ncbi:MAG: hypothetical protein ACTSWR_05275 [Candidatus Helarchaeota archaeon]
MRNIFLILSLILLIFPVLGIIFNYIFEMIIIYLGIELGFLGYIGGVWLWSYLSKSEKITELKNIITVIGIIGFITLFLSLLMGIFTYFQSIILLNNLIDSLNYLFLFITFYMFGYDFSIMNKNVIGKIKNENNNTKDKNEKSKNLFKIDPIIIKNIGSVIGILTSLFFFPLLLIGLYGNILNITMQVFMTFFICILGFGIAYIAWEHIKKSELITGNFKNQLVILSIITTIFVVFLLGLGIYIRYYDNNYFYLQIMTCSIILFMDCMAFYFLGLIISILMVKTKEKISN